MTMVTMSMTVIVVRLAIVAMVAPAVPHAVPHGVPPAGTHAVVPTMDGASPWA